MLCSKWLVWGKSKLGKISLFHSDGIIIPNSQIFDCPWTIGNYHNSIKKSFVPN